MGFSNWFHLDFLSIESETERHFYVLADSGIRYRVNKKFVANRKDYEAGNRNGCISINESHAEQLGLL